MKITARVDNARGEHRVVVETNGAGKSLSIAAKAEGMGSAINGGELLFLALATCYCNDVYREAAKRNLEIKSVHVEVQGEFGGAGEPASNIAYRASVESDADRDAVLALLRHTDTVAEIQNTLRQASAVQLERCDVTRPAV
jgi:uncharacterized OsmC-like protein